VLLMTPVFAITPAANSGSQVIWGRDPAKHEA